MQAADDPGSVAGSAVRLHGPVGADQIGMLCRRVRTLLDDGDGQGLICEVSGRVDLSVVDALARVHLLALRHGARLQVRTSGHELTELLAFTGFDRLRLLVVET